MCVPSHTFSPPYLQLSPAVDIFPERWSSRDGNVESFAEMQANFTKAAVEAATQIGMKLFQIVQGTSSCHGLLWGPPLMSL